MLIDSPRITGPDRNHWAALERYDNLIAEADSARLDRIEGEAISEIRRFLDADEGFVSMSWGKDSVVVAHLAYLADPQVTMKRARVADWEPPETDWVRDAFLDTHPGINYHEALYEGRVPQRGEPGFEAIHADPNRKATNIMAKLIPGRYVSGVRAEESAVRAGSLRWHGTSTERTCRPIIRWTAVDVYAYLHSRHLPVHPTYALSFGGKLDRRWLRVHILGSTKAKRSAVHGRDSESWEETYYGDVLAAARARRAHLWAEQ
ncbi:phosphoadenosine phosphosulfate reductase domain-containing protein [Segatella copri]